MRKHHYMVNNSRDVRFNELVHGVKWINLLPLVDFLQAYQSSTDTPGENPQVAIDCSTSELESSSADDVSEDVASRKEVEKQATDHEARRTKQEKRTEPMVFMEKANIFPSNTILSGIK